MLKKARKRDMPDGLWLKCPSCNEMIFGEEQQKSLRVCPLCGYHFSMSRAERLAMLADPGSFVEWDKDVYSIDFLGFVGVSSYQEKLESNRRKTGQVDAVTCGRARLEGRAIALRHGEAVAIGMARAARLALDLGRIQADVVARQDRLLSRFQLPVSPPAHLRDAEPLLLIMGRDKKTVGGQLRFVLPSRIGHVDLVDGVPAEAVRRVLEA